MVNSHMSPTAPPGRRQRRRAELQHRILQAAMRLFGERGFAATTVEDITEAADVGKGTFFNYFPTKEHVLSSFADIQRGKYEDTLERARSGKESTRALLQRLYRSLPPSQASPALVRSVLGTFLTGDAVRQMMAGNVVRARRMLAEVLTLGQRRGEVRSDMKAMEMARYFQESLFGVAVVWALTGPAEMPPLLDKSFELYWSAIAAERSAVKSTRQA